MTLWENRCLRVALYLTGLVGFGLACLFLAGLMSALWTYW